MSQKPAAISASLVDVRNIAAHKCVRLEIHVPVEQAPLVMAAFGWPTMVDPVPVAIALLDVRKFDAEGNLPVERKERREFCTLPFPQQAGLLSNDLKFQLWMSKTPIGKECEDAAEAIRQYCGVTSRAEIKPETVGGARWVDLLREYESGGR